jgi:streptomycin 3"-adenylyltransferase
MAVSGRHPFDPTGRRPLEVVIFQLADLERLHFPARAEFVYGEWLRDAFASGALPQVAASPEFTLLLAQARREAVPLIGPSLADLVPDIPSHVIHPAIGDLLPELVGSIDGDERNVLLTLARMWRTLATDCFVSKDAAADWACPQLSEQAAVILGIARDAYVDGRDDDLHLRTMAVAQAAEEISGHIRAAL